MMENEAPLRPVYLMPASRSVTVSAVQSAVQDSSRMRSAWLLERYLPLAEAASTLTETAPR
jgi:phage gp36-like protein